MKQKKATPKSELKTSKTLSPSDMIKRLESLSQSISEVEDSARKTASTRSLTKTLTGGKLQAEKSKTQNTAHPNTILASKKIKGEYDDLLSTTTAGKYTAKATGTALTEKNMAQAIKALMQGTGTYEDMVSTSLDRAKASFFQEGVSMTLNQDDWPAQRRYLKWWTDQINNALIKSRREIGKAIKIRIIGSKDGRIMQKDKVEVQELQIEVLKLSEKEVNAYIMKRIKGGGKDGKKEKI
jgi:hypothetical protein